MLQIRILASIVTREEPLKMSDWVTYFDNPANKLENMKKNQQVVTNDNNIYVATSYFENVESVIRINENQGFMTKQLLVEECTFNRCYEEQIGDGGAIYFKGGLASVLTKVCSSECRCRKAGGNIRGQFSYVQLHQKSEGKNWVENANAHSTNVIDVMSSQAVIFSVNGISKNENLNISSNKCQMDAALTVYSGGYDVKCELLYSSIAKNTANLDCINFGSADCIFIVDKCNFVNNQCKNGKIFNVYKQITLKDTCLLGNSGGKNLFPEQLPATYLGCAADFYIEGQKQTEFVVNVLGFEDKYNLCHAYYDSVGELTVDATMPIKREPTQNMKTKKNRAFFSLILITIAHGKL